MLEADAEANATEDDRLGGVTWRKGIVVKLTQRRIDGDVRRQGSTAVQFDWQTETSGNGCPASEIVLTADKLPSEVFAITNVDERNEADGIRDSDVGVSIDIEIPRGVRDVVVSAGSEIDRTQSGGETEAEFVSIIHATKCIEGAHVTEVAIAQGGRHRTEIMLQSGTQLKALEGGICVIAKGAFVAGEGTVVHVPSEAGAFDEGDSATKGAVHPVLAEVKATPDVVGVITQASSDAEVIVDGGLHRGGVFGGRGCSGHNGSGGQSQETQCLQQCVQFHMSDQFGWFGWLRSDTRMALTSSIMLEARITCAVRNKN